MRILSDNPIRLPEHDLWALGTGVADLYDAIASAESLPLTVGVCGPWGCGKTSLLRLLESTIGLPSETRLTTVWFDAWKYERREEVWPALVQSVLLQLASDASDPEQRRAMRLARAFGRVFAGRGLQLATSGLVGAADFEKLLDLLSNEQETAHRHIADFDRDFDDVVKRVIGSRRLVVLIDDLDRCSPLSALAVLEGIKLFMANTRCAFVVALDIESLLTGLERIDGHNNAYRLQYLEKLIQIVRYVPQPDEGRLRAGLEGMLDSPFDHELWELIKSAATLNPRRAKRFVNTLILSGSMDDAPARRVERFHVAKLLVLRVQYPDFYKALLKKPGLWLDFDRHLDRAKNEAAPPGLLAPFVKDPQLCDFMTSTGPKSGFLYPDAPDANRVKELIAAVSRQSHGFLASPVA